MCAYTAALSTTLLPQCRDVQVARELALGVYVHRPSHFIARLQAQSGAIGGTTAHGHAIATGELVRVPLRWRCLLRWRRRLLLQKTMPMPSQPVHNEQSARQQGTRAGDRGCTANVNDGIDESRRLATMVLRSLSLLVALA